MNRLLTFRRAANASPVAIALLVAANLVPLLGVVLLGWDLATLVAVYWAENGVIGVFAIGRILTAGNAGPLAFVTRPAPGGPPAPGAPPPPPVPVVNPVVARLLLVPFFTVHYGLFWLVHGVFVWTALPMMFAAMGATGPTTPFAPDRFGFGFGSSAAVMPDASVVLVAAFALLVSHGASFVFNWLLGGEHAASSPSAEMGAPYGRVVVLHLTILLGAFGVAFLGAPIGALVVMVVLKTAVDLAAHLAERERAGRRLAAARASGGSAAGLDAPVA